MCQPEGCIALRHLHRGHCNLVARSDVSCPYEDLLPVVLIGLASPFNKLDGNN